MIKIYSDGTCANTRVFQEDGSEIKGVTKITWEIEGPNKCATATLTFEEVLCEVKAEL